MDPTASCLSLTPPPLADILLRKPWHSNLPVHKVLYLTFRWFQAAPAGGIATAGPLTCECQTTGEWRDRRSFSEHWNVRRKAQPVRRQVSRPTIHYRAQSTAGSYGL